MKKILITGSSGFIGKSLVNFLNSKFYHIIETGNSKIIDLCKWNEVKNISTADVIIHLAGKNFVPDSFKNPLQYYNNNIVSTINILEKAKNDGSKVIFFSTYLYGNPLYLPINENHPKRPLNPYTQSKLLCEELCEAYNRDFGVPVTIFRPFNIYGPGQNPSFFIPTIINQIDNELIQLNDSRPKRDFIYIDDIVDAVWRSIDYDHHNFNLFNLGSGVSTSVKDIVNMIIKLSHSKARAHFSDQIRQGEILDTVADITKIKNELHWEPKISFAEGLEIMLKTNISKNCNT